MYEYENDEINEMLKEFGIEEDTSVDADESLADEAMGY